MPFAASGEAKIYFDADGEGPPLIFLHGGGSNGAGWWRQIGHFRQTHRYIAIDNRCFGRSEPVDPSIYWPTLLIAGAEDRIVTPRTAKGFADLIPGAEYAQIESAGHSPFFETPECYNGIDSSFLARHAARGGATRAADVYPGSGTEQA